MTVFNAIFFQESIGSRVIFHITNYDSNSYDDRFISGRCYYFMRMRVPFSEPWDDGEVALHGSIYDNSAFWM